MRTHCPVRPKASDRVIEPFKRHRPFVIHHSRFVISWRWSARKDAPRLLLCCGARCCCCCSSAAALFLLFLLGRSARTPGCGWWRLGGRRSRKEPVSARATAGGPSPRVANHRGGNDRSSSSFDVSVSVPLAAFPRRRGRGTRPATLLEPAALLPTAATVRRRIGHRPARLPQRAVRCQPDSMQTFFWHLADMGWCRRWPLARSSATVGDTRASLMRDLRPVPHRTSRHRAELP